jgi:hypothetical protein
MRVPVPPATMMAVLGMVENSCIEFQKKYFDKLINSVTGDQWQDSKN